MQSAAKLRLLLVDDSADFRKSFGLWASQYPELELIDIACSGEEALWRVNLLHPDVVLLDLNMPGLDGFETTRRIKMEAAAPLVIILSLWDGNATRGSAAMAGADGFVAKTDLVTQLHPLLLRLTAGPRAGGSGRSGGPGERLSPPAGRPGSDPPALESRLLSRVRRLIGWAWI